MYKRQSEAAPDVCDLDASAVLDAVVERRRAADQAEADLLALAVHWVDLHPVTPEHPAATFPTQRTGGLASALGPTFFDPAPLAGDGTPGVAEYAVEELAAALNLSHPAGLALVAEAVELRFRLPRLWALVQSGDLQAWKARQVAKATTMLSKEAVGFVDRHLAVTARSNRLPALNPVLHEARLRCDPDQAAAVEQDALDHRGVWLDHRESTATTLLTARIDTLDALDLDGTGGDLAGLMGRLGDDRTLDVRRASALGLLAHPQRALDLAGGTQSDTDPAIGSGVNGSRGWRYRRLPDPPDGDQPGPTYERTSPTSTPTASPPTPPAEERPQRWLRCPSPHGAMASKPPAPTRRGHHRAPVRRFRGSRRSHLDQRLRHRTGFTRLQHPDNAADAARTRAFRRRGPPNGYFHTSHTSSHATHRFTCVSRGGVAFIVGAWTCQESSSWCSPSRGPSI